MEVNEPAVAYGKQKYTIEEYLEMENAATEKHEYYQGEIFAMSGAKMRHNHITSAILISLGKKLAGRDCNTFGSDLRVHVEKNTLFTYPDVTIVCGKEITLNDDEYNLLNPTVIFEVLSPSTRRYDLGDKFRLYQDIPSLKMYVTVDSEAVNVQAWHVNEQGIWEHVVYTGLNETVALSAINESLAMSGIYERTDLL